MSDLSDLSDRSLVYLSATEALQRFRDGSLLPSELMAALLARIDEVNPGLNAFTAVYAKEAMAGARLADERWRQGTARPLEGIALAVKDNVPITGHTVTYGSKLYADNVVSDTHPGVARMLEAGAVVIGRTTMPEFGEAGNCYTPLWGVTRNPWNREYGPGGSSSGAGVTLAAGMTTIADGSDIGGSIRIPASCCGVYGYKAPFGRNPNDLPNTFDPYMHYGPLARTVEDVCLMQSIIAGRHPDDISTVNETVDYTALADVKGWKIAYSIDLGYFPVDTEVRDNLLSLVEGLRALGATVEEVELDWGTEAFDAWLATNSSRGSAARFVHDFERDVDQLADYTADMIAHGKSLTPDDLTAALEVHVAMYGRMGRMLEEYDAFLCPTTALPSVGADRSPLDLAIEINGEIVPEKIAEAWFMTYPFNMLSQLPVLSIPSGMSSIGVPTGVQVVGPAFDDMKVMSVARAVEKHVYKTDFWQLEVSA
ncbi:amidase [Ruicaihuangia caeni]|uniref:Amidase n=1 Tax=Ruicaihuangia caeni TaxID=3042517 RepID=A0AAW6T3B4_9MICO|nr:amidase [Klugiella sp. YN-L-19]MDI2098315.1 amidase [Klugiella sp. YN-L-19]